MRRSMQGVGQHLSPLSQHLHIWEMMWSRYTVPLHISCHYICHIYIIHYSSTSLIHHSYCITGTQCYCKDVAIWNFRYQQRYPHLSQANKICCEYLSQHVEHVIMTCLLLLILNSVCLSRVANLIIMCTYVPTAMTCVHNTSIQVGITLQK